MATFNIALSLALAVAGSAGVLAADGPNGLVAVLTDYGNSDYYAGALEGAIYSVSTGVKVSTITNGVWPFDIADGAFMLLEASKAYPPGTTFVAIVDPGVGTERMPIALKTKDGKYFVGPDNGLLDLVADRCGVAEARRITNRGLMREAPLSTTFHGRDIFGPAGAHIASGTPFAEVGPLTDFKECVSIPEAAIGKDGRISGETLYVDHYGNLITNIEPGILERAGFKPGDVLTMRLGKKKIRARFSKAYGDVPAGDCVCLINSSGFFEIAVNMGSLVHRLGLKRKPGVTVYPGREAEKQQREGR